MRAEPRELGVEPLGALGRTGKLEPAGQVHPVRWPLSFSTFGYSPIVYFCRAATLVSELIA